MPSFPSPRAWRRCAAHAVLLFVVLAAAVAFSGAPARAATTILTANADQATLQPWDMMAVADSSATDGKAVEFYWSGTIQFQVHLSSDADTLAVRVHGDQCAGPPAYAITIDGVVAINDTVTSTTWITKSYAHFLGAGSHTIDVTLSNDNRNPLACDRNLYLDVLTASASSTLTPPAAPAIPAGFVHQSGTKLLDGAGNSLKLRGVDLAGYLMWEGWIWGPPMAYVGESAMMANLTKLVGQTEAQQFQTAVDSDFITSGDFRAMGEDGLNVARVPFDYRLLEDDTNPFVYKASGWAVLDNLVNEAKQNNIYLILDMHAAPCSQAMSFTADYVPSGGTFLWWSSTCQARTVAMWKAIASRYANDNVIAGYDLLNEPVTSDSTLLSLYQRITAAIRSVDPNHLIIYEGSNAARDFSLFNAPLDSNEMLSAHDYSWMIPNQTLAARMPGYDAAANSIKAPMWFGEFGQDTYAGIQSYVSTFDADPLVAGYADWTWKQAPGMPALETIQESAAAKALLTWIDNPVGTPPTLAQAQQGLTDFLNEVQAPNTQPDGEMAQILG